MKKLMNVGYLALLLTISLCTFFACQKSEDDQLLQQTQLPQQSENAIPGVKLDLKSLVTVENGILSFQKSEDFDRVYRYLNENQDRLAEIKWANDLGFVSMKAAFDQMSDIEFQSEAEINTYAAIAFWKEKGSEKQLDRVISNPTYAALFNNNGVVKVGAKMIRFNKDNVVFFDAATYSPNMDVTTIPGAQVVLLPENSGAEDRSNSCTTVYAWSNGKQYRKVVGESTPEITVMVDPLSGVGVLTSTGWFFLETRNYKRGFLGNWYSNKANIIGIKMGNVTIRELYNESSCLMRFFGCCSTGTRHYVTDGENSGFCII